MFPHVWALDITIRKLSQFDLSLRYIIRKAEKVTSSNYRSQLKDTHSKNTSLTWETMVNYNKKIKKA